MFDSESSLSCFFRLDFVVFCKTVTEHEHSQGGGKNRLWGGDLSTPKQQSYTLALGELGNNLQQNGIS